MTIRVLLADDHGMLRDALQQMLEKESDVQIVDAVSNGREAVQRARELRPDVVVMDIGMPELNGVEATARILARNPEIRVIGLSTYSDRRFVAEMLKAGAMGYIAKTSAGTELVRAIRAVMDNRRYLCPKTTTELAKQSVHSGEPAIRSQPLLTHREREVLQLVAEGLRTSDIAVRMHVAESTIEVHRRNIMRKLDLRNIADLTKYAIREGLTAL